MKINKNGFTIVEASIVLTLSMFATIGTYKYMSDKAEETRINSVSGKIVKAVGALDQRVYIDGYDQSLWPDVKDYLTNVQVQTFLARELISKKASCGDSVNGWEPTINDPSDPNEVSYKEKLKLVPCNPWGESGKLEFGLKSSLFVNTSATEIRDVNIFFKFESAEDFENNFLSFKKILNKLKETDTTNITGSHSYSFVDMSNSEPQNFVLSQKECIDIRENCGLMAQYSSDGTGLEYLDVTGANSMIGTKVSFVEQSGGTVLKDCMSFEKDASGVWNPVNSVVCGIGIDEDKGTDYVEADVFSTTSKRIFLDQLCSLDLDPSNPSSTPVQVPCGLSTDYGISKAIAVVDTVEAENAYISMLEVKNTYTDELSVVTELKVDGTSNLNELNVNGLATFNENVEMLSDGNVANDLYVDGTTELAFLKVTDTATFEKDVQIDGYLDVAGYVQADHLKLGQIEENDINSSCNVEGAMKIFADGGHSEPVICSEFDDIDGNTKIAWKLANARVGQVMPFDAGCPAGFEYFTEASGRFLIGSNEDYLDSLSPTELTNAINDGKVFLDPNGAVLRYKRGDTGGEAFHTLTIAEMPEHDHKVPTVKASCSGTDCAGFAMVEMNNSDTVWSREMEIPTGTSGEGKSHENRPPFYAVNYCIYDGK